MIRNFVDLIKDNKMSSFYAVPVKSGDCFILDRDDQRIVVDGGGNNRIIETMKTAEMDMTKEIRVLVCTHNDSDHTRGLLTLIEHYPKNIQELWIPAIWSELTERFCNKPYDSFNKVMEYVRYYLHNSDFKQEILSRDISQKNEIKYDGYLSNKDRTKCLLWNEYPESVYNLFRNICLCIELDRNTLEDINQINELLREVSNIISIYFAAHKKNIIIRYFQYGIAPSVSDGITDFLVPINSSEYFTFSKKLDVFELLVLTKANEESLVFYAPECPESPGVLFSADSDYQRPIMFEPKPNRTIIVTVPHHGSDSNIIAYKTIGAWAGKTLYVRSGKKTEAGRHYIENIENKYCTCCNLPNSSHRIIAVVTNGNYWNCLQREQCTCDIEFIMSK